MRETYAVTREEQRRLLTESKDREQLEEGLASSTAFAVFFF
jgi:hypothetical protein